ncbi:MAG: hypothetical protein HY017_17175 [Betaproteobacteria bacterium]|nr:hypothetical protein [Betaproteobacteria bacterium]
MLIVLAVIMVVGTTGVLLSALNGASNKMEIVRRADSARALDEAKQALLGFVASQAATDSNPGRLPCPEAPSYFGTANAGLSQNDYQVNNTYPVGGYCGSGTVVGRLPWRTLGISKLVDGYDEPLWYVISPGFAMPSFGGSLTINSNTAAQLTVDGVSASAVALIIAPGAAMTVESATGCTARVQARSAETAASPPAPDLRDYLECDNATSPADAIFVTSGATTSYNDQVLRITDAELFDAVEPVVAKRIETEIAPVLKKIYLGTDWSLPAIPTLPTTPTDYIYPYAVTFADPTTSLFQGSSGVTEGLLPLYAAGVSSSFVYWYDGSSSRKPTVTKVGAAGSISGTPSCTATSTTTVSCSVTYKDNPRIKITATARSVARTMRQLNSAAVPLTWADPLPPAGNELKVTAAFDTSTSNGRASVYVEYSLLPDYSGSWITRTLTFPIGILADHSLTDPNNATTGWFVKNNWHHVVYYAFAPNYTANQSHSCATSSTCLTVNNLTPTGKQRALLILTGRTLSFQARSTAAQRANLTNYFEDPENRDLDLVFVKNTTSKTYNDRVVVVDSNP